MIDTHSHILPNLDDGAATLPQALNFVRQAARQGVTAIFATPHCNDGVFNCEKHTILTACDNLAAAARKNAIEIRILPGAEIRVTHDLIALYDAGRLLTLGYAGKFLLLELPPLFITPAILRMLRRLQNRGITPIIAHAERNPMIIDQPGLATEIHNCGARLQVTAASLTGDYGRIIFKTARALVETGRVFCLGSDIHPGRKYRIKAAADKLKKWIGRHNMEKLLWKNPEQMCRQLWYDSYHPDHPEKNLFKKTGR